MHYFPNTVWNVHKLMVPMNFLAISNTHAITVTIFTVLCNGLLHIFLIYANQSSVCIYIYMSPGTIQHSNNQVITKINEAERSGTI